MLFMFTALLCCPGVLCSESVIFIHLVLLLLENGWALNWLVAAKHNFDDNNKEEEVVVAAAAVHCKSKTENDCRL